MRNINLLLSCLILSACAAPPAPGISGGWQPLNGYTDSVREIPLVRPYYFQALPIDVTVKGLLERWSKEANLPLVYEHPSDFTLQTNVARIQEPNIEDAVRALNKIYEAQHLTVQAVSGRGLVVSYLFHDEPDPTIAPIKETVPIIDTPRIHTVDNPVNIDPYSGPGPAPVDITNQNAP